METFIEKPGEATAHEARATGSLWNTMVLVAKGKELWSLGWTCVPEIMPRFEWLREAVDSNEELKVLDAIYDAMPRRNFSSHVLQSAPDRLAVMEMKDVLWSDWGNPERIESSLEKSMKRPAVVEEPLPFLYVGRWTDR